jgi:hypothetical protein
MLEGSLKPSVDILKYADGTSRMMLEHKDVQLDQDLKV